MGWFTDNIIDAYASLLKQEVDIREARVLSCFLYTNMMQGNKKRYSFDAVRHWTKKQDLLASTRVCVPMHTSNHWSLAVVTPAAGVVYHYDSLRDSRQLGQAICRWAADTAEQAGQTSREWKLIAAESWQQQNFYDCGVFVCSTIRNCMLKDLQGAGRAPPRHFRRHIMASLRAGRIVQTDDRG